MAITGPDILLYEKKGKVVTIKINRPERLNALSIELLQRLRGALEQFRDDDDAWVAIITGEGKAFCAGADIRDRAERNKQGIPEPKRPRIGNLECWKPMIAAINGIALGAGFWLAMECDIRLAAEDAELGIPESRWNLGIPWMGIATRHLTMAHAMELALWGDARITAQRGYEMGFVNRVVPKEQLMDEAMSWAERALKLAPAALRKFKELIQRGHNLTYEEAWAFGVASQQSLGDMEDTVEGGRAFTEKRQPKFKNR